MKEIKLSAREIVSFIHSGGDLTNEFSQNAELIDGTRAHQHLQSQYKESDQKEVYVSSEFIYDELKVVVSGRMDGLLHEDKKIIIEEIKSTKTDLNYIEIDTRPEHLMQAKLYAYMYLEQIQKRSIYIRLTYINTLSYETKSFNKRFTKKELDEFFIETIKSYIAWYKIVMNHEEERIKSIEGLTFPFPIYREGQRELMAASYKTILGHDILYAIAPTGIGKTIATIFSSLKAIKNSDEKIFYLTAKDVGKTVAINTIQLLEEKGLVCKSIEITAKEKTCFMEKVECNPEYCPYAKGFFNRLNTATEDIFKNETLFTREIVEDYAQRHTVCPFEFALYLSYFADLIICDYNYAFDPRTHLKRYFDETTYKPILLVDEAHNLIDRSRAMYSASFSLSNIKTLDQITKKLKPTVKTEIKKLLDTLDFTNDILEKVSFYKYDLVNPEIVNSVKKIINKLELIIDENKEHENKKQVMDLYFELYRFLKIYEYYTESFIFTVEKVDDDFIYSIKCLDASEYILKTVKNKTIGSIFFSATLFPLEYYKKLITQDEGEYIKLVSPFKQEHLDLIVINDTSTRYADRNQSIQRIIEVIHTMVNSKKGNYIVFFPSFAYLNLVVNHLNNEVFDYELIIQSRNMSGYERQNVLDSFKKDSKYSKLGMFVMGGLFSEGIDYVGEMLSGVLIVGVGLPALSDYNNLLKSYFDEKFNNGFDYAYTYPGLNKIVQAVGRVIRTETDRGIAILLDDRFSSYKYKSLYPVEWNHAKVINNLDDLEYELDNFWDK